jgi:cyclopropane fatty-acyl-phospholipid synthase-like methyltransferase
MAASRAYGGQDRGNAAAYHAYYAAMDSTMRQKLAFVGAHFLLDPGSRIADMGCGSGYGTYQLALLNVNLADQKASKTLINRGLRNGW